MEDGRFETRLRCAVSAGWTTLLIGVLWMMLGWCWWMAILGSPGLTRLVEAVWGGTKVAEMQQFVWLFFGLMKLMFSAWLFAVIFLHLWYRKLRKAA